MRAWFDTEFIEDGITIDLISIGAVREDGLTFYAENRNCRLDRASDWVKENVVPKLGGLPCLLFKSDIAERFLAFAGEKPEFWAYYADYDWVVLCQLYGTMMQLPPGWPKYCLDVKQLCMAKGNPRLPAQDPKSEHGALADALWVKEAWEFLQGL